MKPIILYNSIVPFKGYIAMALFPFIFWRKEYKDIEPGTTIRHELIHFEQQKELFLIFFYLWYIVEYIVRLIMYRDHEDAYRNISFEREARINCPIKNYTETRKRFNFVRYLNYGKI